MKHSLADTKLAEDHIEQILNVDPPGDPTQAIAGPPQVLCPEFHRQMRLTKSFIETIETGSEVMLVSLPRRHQRLTPPKHLASKMRKRIQQPGEPLPFCNRQSKTKLCFG